MILNPARITVAFDKSTAKLLEKKAQTPTNYTLKRKRHAALIDNKKEDSKINIIHPPPF